MNRRQKKKQFKKIYGMNPKQYNKYMQEHWPEICNAISKAAYEGIKIGLEQIWMAAVEAAEEIRNRMDEWTKIIKEAAVVIETYYKQEGEKQDGDNGINSQNVRNGLPDCIDSNGADNISSLFNSSHKEFE